MDVRSKQSVNHQNPERHEGTDAGLCIWLRRFRSDAAFQALRAVAGLLLSANSTGVRTVRRSGPPIPRLGPPVPLLGAIALALALLVISGPDATRAQSLTTLVSNQGQGSDHEVNVNTERAQAFTPGWSHLGFIIREIEVDYRDAEGDDLEAKICRASQNNDNPITDNPQLLCVDLTPPGTFTQGRLTFTVPGDDGTGVLQHTTHTLVLSSPGGESVTLGGTNNGGEDYERRPGWSIRDRFHVKRGSSWQSVSSLRSFRITVKGYPLTRINSHRGRPQTNDVSKTTAINQTVTFNAEDFGYAGDVHAVCCTQAGVLSGVRVRELPDDGTLQLFDTEGNPTAVSANNDISRADIDAGRFRFRPDTGERGEPYTRFAVSVKSERLNEFSAFPNWITINVSRPVLVSNLAETSASTAMGVGNRTGTQNTQGFGTGSHDGSYLLTGVSVAIDENNFSGGETATFKIYDSDNDGTPRDEIYTLVTPELTAGSAVFFAAPSGAELKPDTNYHVVFQGSGGIPRDLALLTTGSNDQSGESGWTIEDAFRSDESLVGNGRAVKLVIYGIQNSAATGDPTITGEARVGLTLTADTSAIRDADGLNNVSYSYQWIQVDADGTSNATPITGATGSAYTLTGADEGRRIRVRVSFPDDISFPEERTSDAFPSIGTVIDDTLVSNVNEAAASSVNAGNATGTLTSQGFGTGSSSAGYLLTSVSVAISRQRFSGTETATFKVYDSENDGTPKNEVYALTTPTLTEGATVFFTAPSDATLAANSTYHVVFQGSGNSLSDLALTTTNSNDQTGRTGWTMEDAYRYNERLTRSGRAVMIGIHGEPVDSTPPELDDTTAPVLAADGRTLTITFNETMSSTSVPATSAFTVKATPMGGSEETLALATSGGVTVSGSTSVLKMEKPIAHNDGSVTVKYDKPGSGSVLQDANGNDLATFPDQAVTNNSTIPRVSISAGHSDWTPSLALPDLVLTRSNTSDSELDVNWAVTGAFTSNSSNAISANNANSSFTPVYAANASGSVTVTVAEGSGYLPAIAPNNAVTLDLKVPASGNYVTISHRQTSHTVTEGDSVNHLLDFVAHEGVAQPRDEIGVSLLTAAGSATINADYEHLSANADVSPGDWTASNQEWVASRRVTLQTEDDEEYEGDETFTLSLLNQQGVSDKITFAPGTENALITIVDDETLGVSGIEVSSTPAESYYVATNTITFEVTFNGSVTVDISGGTPQFAFDIGGQTRQALYSSGSDSKVLVFSYTVATVDGDDRDGISWDANALDRQGGTIRFTSTEATARVNADLDHVAQDALPGHKVDTQKPTLVEASALDAALTLTYSEELNTTAPVASAFSVTVNLGTPANPTAVSIAGREVTLTLADAVNAGDTVILSYTKPSNNPIKDLSGKEADALTNRSVMTAPPVEVVVQFDQASYSVDEGNMVNVVVRLDKDPQRELVIPITATGENDASGADYDVPADVTFASGETEKTLVFTATDDPVDDEGERVRLTFSTPPPRAVMEGSIDETTVRINDDDDPLTVQSIAVTSTATNDYYRSGATIQFTVTFTGPVAVDTGGGTPEFEFELAGASRQAAYASGSASNSLVFSYTVATGDGEDRDGISWNTNTLSRNGGKMEYSLTEVAQREDAVLSHSAQPALSGHKVDSIKPTLEEAEVDDDMLFLNYHEELNAPVPAASAFSVIVDGGSPANPTAVAISGSVVTLTLSSGVARGATVTVSYTAPGSNPIKDLAGNEADGFSGRNVVPTSDIENLSASPGNRTVTLTWDALSDSELTRYQYRYMNTDDSDWNPDWTNVPGSSASTTSFTARNLTNGLLYTFEIRPVYTKGGQAEPGREGDIDAAPRGAMVAPRNFEADPGNEAGVLLLSWDDPRDVTITGYEYRHRTLTDGNWNPDWTEIDGSDATTTAHTLEKLTWEVLYTVELRALRGIETGPGARAQGTPPEDISRPSSLRDVNLVTRDHARLENGEVLITCRSPERLGNRNDSELIRIEYRYANSSEVLANVAWRTAPAHLLDHSFFFVRDLEVGELHTFQVRAINDDNKDGSITTVQGTPCCAADTQPPPPTAPSTPAGASATSGKVYTETVEVGSGADIRYARSAFVDVTLTWGSSSDPGNAVAGYEYRWAEGSRVSASSAWLSVGSAGNDDLSLKLLRLKPGTRYAFEVRSVTSHGPSASVATARLVTTSYTGPYYTLSASSSVNEGQAVTITVSRSNRSDGASTVLIQIVDDAELTGYPTSYPTPGVVFGSGDSRATTTFTVNDDNLNTTARTLKVRIAEVVSEGSSTKEKTDNTFSAGWSTVNVTDTTP